MTLNELRNECYQISADHGWHDHDAITELFEADGIRAADSVRAQARYMELLTATRLCLIHSEVSEALEAVRHGNPVSEHCPEISGLEEELADVVIRVLDLAGESGMDIDRAVRLKMDFNRNRPYRHGGKKL